MNLLTEKLPGTIEVGGVEFPVKTDFRTWIRFSKLMSSKDMIVQNLPEAIRIIFGCLPPSLEGTVTGMLNFFAPDASAKADNGIGRSNKRIYDFEYDSSLIIAAFRQQYGIDLLSSDMHWYEFKALLAGLTDSTLFVKVVGYRGMNLSDIKDKERKAFYRQMKEVYKLSDNRSEEEREADMIAGLEGAF